MLALSPSPVLSQAITTVKSSTFTLGGNLTFNTTASGENDLGDLLGIIAHWLSPTNYYAIQKDTHEKVAPGTGKWLFGTQAFENFVNQSPAVLWGTGIPGAGKTCFTSVIIQYLEEYVANQSDMAVAFVYCRYQDELSVAQILASLLRQLIEDSEAVLRHVADNLYTPCLKKNTTASQTELQRMLQEAVRLKKRTFIVLDALDELRDDVRHGIVDFFISNSLDVSIFLTSRPLYLSAISCPTFDIRPPTTDLRFYIRREVGLFPKLQSLLRSRGDLMDEITTKIETKSDGMFLLATLQLSALKGATTVKSIREVLHRLPATLSEMYALTLERILNHEQEERMLALRALLWVAYAHQPLTSKEVLEALAIDIHHSELDPDNYTTESTLLSACCGLLEIGKENNTVALIHYTAHTFFTSHWQKDIFANPHTFISTCCVKYLEILEIDGHTVTEEKRLDQLMARHTLSRYVCWNLGYHTSRSINEQGIIPPSVFHFLQTHPSILLHQGPLCRHMPHSDSGNITHFAALHGITPLLIANSNLLSENSDRGCAPLFYACLQGHIDIVNLLLSDQNVDVNHQSSSGQTALSAACEYGHLEIVKILLQKGGLANTVNRAGWSALHFAAACGFSGVVGFLVDFHDIGACHEPMSSGAEPGYAAEQKIIHDDCLLHPCNSNSRIAVLHRSCLDLNATDKEGKTALNLASHNGDEAVVEALLRCPSLDVNCSDDTGKSPLMFASLCGHVSIIQLLLSSPALNVNAQDEIGWSALMFAALDGYERALNQLLLFPKTDLDLREDMGRNVLMIACSYGDHRVVQLLLRSSKINVNAKDNTGLTALMIASKSGHRRAVRNLLRAFHGIKPGRERLTCLTLTTADSNSTSVGLDLNAQDNDGRNALRFAIEEGHEAIALALLDTSGILVNLTDPNGYTSLHKAAELGQLEEMVVRSLLEHADVDLNAKLRECECCPPVLTALRLAHMHGHEGIVTALTEASIRRGEAGGSRIHTVRLQKSVGSDGSR